MSGKRWLRIASGVCLLIASLIVVVQSQFGSGGSNHLYYATSLVAVFGYLFLTSQPREKDETDTFWWW